MNARRDILVSTLTGGLRIGLSALLFGQSGLGQLSGLEKLGSLEQVQGLGWPGEPGMPGALPLLASGPPGAGGLASVPAMPPESAVRARLVTLTPLPGTLAQVMQAQPRVSVIDFQQRVAQSGGDLKVLASVLGQAQQGNIPSYDERLGISRAEFQRYLIFRNTLESSGKTVKLTLYREGNRLTFGDAPGAGILKGLSIDTFSGDLFTQEGFSARPRPVQISSAQDGTGMGASSGLAWDVKGSNPRSQNALQGHLSLLQFTGGQVLLSYNRVSIQKGRISEDNLNLMFRK
ncbi:hypothetical protein [Deinococcus altitudinis]|uniref:hypothetical protein n=1 Tax=Deinococcus altitudinis TaxID=468914 RepID=UPI0038927B5A